MKKVFENLDEPRLIALAETLAEKITVPLVIYLEGDLGAGKTTFSRALIRKLGFDGAVKSPTYTLLEQYSLSIPVLHFDLYRLSDPEELEYLGVRDLTREAALWLIEWPGKGLGVLPQADMIMAITHQKDKRTVTCLTRSEAAIKLFRH